jgi:hypothetical protein
VETTAAHFEEPPHSLNHTLLRETAWMGGEMIEGRYFLSWANGVNEFRRSHREFDADYQNYVIGTWPSSQMFLKSFYWREYFLVLLRQRYRESDVGTLFPIRIESKAEKALRIFLVRPSLEHAELARILKTTEKQLLRMSMLQLAYRELSQNFERPQTTKQQSKR